MTNTGLTSRDIETISAILIRYDGIRRVRLFGSRAKWDHKPWSDIDLAIDGEYDALHIQNDFEESTLPYFIDIINSKNCSSRELLEHIDRVGKILYEKNS